MTTRPEDIAAQVEARAKALEGAQGLPDISPVFIRLSLNISKNKGLHNE